MYIYIHIGLGPHQVSQEFEMVVFGMFVYLQRAYAISIEQERSPTVWSQSRSHDRKRPHKASQKMKYFCTPNAFLLVPQNRSGSHFWCFP